jgi:phosphatidylserine decarboxylase
MKIHKEGRNTIAIALLLTGGLGYLLGISGFPYWLMAIGALVLLCFLFFITQFFRIPKRHKSYEADDIVCPADGEIVVIEEVIETEYLQTKCTQISIFMSPLNVHANYVPVEGKVLYTQYHPGKHLVAWNPKSSTDNERTTLVIETKNGEKVLIRQIAGAVARRICFYPKVGDDLKQGQEFGFIKFGSRVDVFLPLEAKLDIKIGDLVKNKLNVLGKL